MSFLYRATPRELDFMLITDIHLGTLEYQIILWCLILGLLMSNVIPSFDIMLLSTSLFYYVLSHKKRCSTGRPSHSQGIGNALLALWWASVAVCGEPQAESQLR
ncbi:hypothetical protein VNO77_06668 [Canavalia gladiata]|uniref:Uncharacterized protein n=1 Tax=Canavalia gladiata TaxID=3824 RepID=A0AAN9MCC5_CANGL